MAGTVSAGPREALVGRGRGSRYGLIEFIDALRQWRPLESLGRAKNAPAAKIPPKSTALEPIVALSPEVDTSSALGALAAVERQSRCLVEIAGTVTRARHDAAIDLNGDAWVDLMARVSHDLRTPLNAVIGFSDVMNSELLGPVGHPRYKEYARHIRDCGRELLKSAEDTLAFTSLLAHPEFYGRKSPLVLAHLAEDAWSFFATETKQRNIRFEIHARDGLELLGERRATRQVLINLLSEALKRVDNGGLVVLTAHVEVDLVRLEISVEGADQGQRAEEGGSLAVCLARALLELQGAGLVEATGGTGAWRAETVLSCAAQPDFFDMGVTAAPRAQALAC